MPLSGPAVCPPAPRPAARRTARQSASGASVALALAGVLTAGLVACSGPEEATPSPTPPTAGLVILAGEPGAATLTIHDLDGSAASFDLPDPGTAWIGAGPGRRLVATLDDGTVEVSDRVTPGVQPSWSPAADADADLAPEPLRFAAWAPGGAHVAALAADFGVAARLTLTIVDPVVGATLLLPIPGEPVVAPLTWLSDSLLLIQTDRATIVVDTTTGELGEGPPLEAPGGTAISIAPGSLIAIADPAGGAVEIRSVDRWLAGDTGDPLARLEAGAEVGSIALTPSGDRLAIVWQPIDGPGSLVVYRRADGWPEAARSTLPGESARAAVDWLR